ncbi:MAG: tetraacyldisaccharide 4'-kinase [Gammaproteobacteria bacterium]|nr:tetraacyldisaccharide 4'-kinase [Gammaproteobacteria bacterium]
MIDSWYHSGRAFTLFLLPLSLLFAMVVWLRRQLYHWRLLKMVKVACPVIVVGNLSVGGNGKTPLVIALAQWLQQQGYSPGIVSRGYGGCVRQATTVTAASDPRQVGDEPVLIVQRSGCPVVVGRRRAEAATKLLADNRCDVIISDDGLQHYALGRDIEVVVVDGKRRFGNGCLLPAGPLRESLARLQQVDYVVSRNYAEPGEHLMQWCPAADCQAVVGNETKPLTEFTGQTVHAVAAIAQPESFFATLRECGITVIEQAFPDHYALSAADINFNDELAVIMTEKDAVKCRLFDCHDCWYLPVTVELPTVFLQALTKQLQTLT